MFIFSVIDALKKYKVNYAIAGGYALALHGAVRGTVDIDIVIKLNLKDFNNAEKALQSLGLKPRLPVSAEEVFNFREEYIRNKNMIAWNFINTEDPTQSVDIIITEDLKKIKTKKIKTGEYSINVISIDDLIKMKEKSDRPQDRNDIEALKELRK